ncbi:amino acid racemase [Acidovorax sp. LjRoot129]|uniref:aspartate/glutamate racemase family protein n=1 Tax=Acidovorax sp. LjRoot129 TaxID=3342260 RepID=UPI003ED1357E
MNAEHTRKVGILGGMGPAAGADFLQLFVSACEMHMRSMGRRVHDQAFPEHWLVQIPAPDRTDALLRGGTSPLPTMLEALDGMARQGVACVAIACNTAHAWHAELRRHAPQIELLHIVQETVHQLLRDGFRSVGLLATLGTYQLGLYTSALNAAGIQCHLPAPDEQAEVMRGIVEGVKAGQMSFARECFDTVGQRMVERHACQALVLACTEIPLALTSMPQRPEVELVNPAAILSSALDRRAYSI